MHTAIEILEDCNPSPEYIGACVLHQELKTAPTSVTNIDTNGRLLGDAKGTTSYNLGKKAF